ncbi:MAG TPA: hypothetical protein VL092_07960 [Chitinophagaceae bacterium]|nr:hypothetical protein [Chitinophagaceae bacterium]
MRQFTAIVLLFCLSCQCVLKLSIVAWFELNQEYIAATLCENRDKPELVCCGKCVLTKQLKKADDTEQKDKKNTQNKAEQHTMVVYVLPSDAAHHSSSSAYGEPAVQNPVVPAHFTVAVLSAIFHPPGYSIA